MLDHQPRPVALLALVEGCSQVTACLSGDGGERFGDDLRDRGDEGVLHGRADGPEELVGREENLEVEGVGACFACEQRPKVAHQMRHAVLLVLMLGAEPGTRGSPRARARLGWERDRLQGRLEVLVCTHGLVKPLEMPEVPPHGDAVGLVGVLRKDRG